MYFNFTKYSKIYFIISGVLVLTSLIFLGIFGLRFGIEFRGGTSLEVEFEIRPSNKDIQESLKEFELGEITIRPMGEKGVVLQFRGIDEQIHQKIISKLSELSPAEEKSFNYIGPVVGRELRNKTQLAIVFTLLAINLYIAFAFRKVSVPVSSWKYGVASLIALCHDILIPLGVFAYLGKFYNVEITIPIIAALLTVLGFSVHDTIIIFDRVRENIFRKGAEDFEENVNKSLNQTLGRSLSTVLTTLFPLFAIYFLGGETLKYFALALIIGISAGTYSSIFLAAPLLVFWHKISFKS